MIDFRPITPLGWVHKLVTQVFSARLKRVIGKLVQDTQIVFINGRSIFKGWVVALVGMGMDQEEVHRLASFLGCQIGVLPMKYLGLQLGSRRKDVQS